MRAHVSLGIAITVVLASGSALAQAAAESVLLNGSSATSTVKTGTALGNALNNATKNLSNQMHTVNHRRLGSQSSAVQAKKTVNRKQGLSPTKSAAASTPRVSNGSSLITSIRGGRLVPATSASTNQPQAAPANPPAVKATPDPK